MSDRIQLLPEVVANQIAAGEVVNRPASVVKEMMENAIDAGATCVVVNFREGGRDLIQIVDNGCGMSPVDARLAFDRHATSKIRTAEDIYKLDTFGFRGEALASIAAVAQVELRTRQPEDELGTVTEINGGQFAGQTVVSCPAGSQFMVRNLFYNVPARRRFLEKSNVSAGHIKAEFQRVALCNPQVRFELYNNDAPVYLLQPASLAGRIVDVVGAAVKHNLLEVVADTSIVKLKGYVGRPAAARKTRPDQYFFVNGRYFRSAYFQKAVLKAYEKLIPEGSFPSFFLYFEIDPERIDVNVHPQKTEVKFADEEAVWQIVNAAVRETLGKTGAVPMMDFDDAGQVDIPVMERNAFYAEPPSRSDMDYNPFQEDYGMPRSMVRPARLSDVSSGFRPSDEFTIESGTVGEEAPVADGFEDFRSGDGFDFVASTETAGQPCLIEPSEPERFTQFVRLPEGYAAALYGDRLMAVDLNRARECVLYEEYLLLLKSGSAVSQQLLFPEQLLLSESEYALLEENLVDFAALGFDLELAGGGAVRVKGTPADMPADQLDVLVYDLLRLFELPVSGEEMRRGKLAATMARAGVGRRKSLFTDEEVRSLLDALAECAERSFTPSGKSVMAELTLAELKAKLA
ncbi:DNA mismatch repair endonuclease MutL [uncultured Alistipes sp.]|uniref:DNA mismatch repair endonuclease MutL n=1 Tax=uncultured Alistipes sp. TaxID=538949 RepID=UPI00261AB272|nr:DNA mismatch repair endonuclease MutL [uncultured Alistipes sp.]